MELEHLLEVKITAFTPENSLSLIQLILTLYQERILDD